MTLVLKLAALAVLAVVGLVVLPLVGLGVVGPAAQRKDYW